MPMFNILRLKEKMPAKVKIHFHYNIIVTIYSKPAIGNISILFCKKISVFPTW